MCFAVCDIRVKSHSKGTGFLVLDRHILTNAHVIEDITKEGILQDEVSVRFTFGTNFLTLNVKQNVIVYMCNAQDWQWEMDFALLELDVRDHEAPILPPALLSTYGPPSGTGEIYIIGHPDGGGKTIERSSIIEEQSFSKYLKYKQGTLLHYYTTTMHDGSSGSPIIGNNLHLLGMHTGYLNLFDGSVIQFGIPMRFILQNLFLQMIEQNKWEPLKKFILEAMKGEHTIGLIAECIRHMLGEQDVEGVLSTVIDTAKMSSGFEKLSSLFYIMGPLDFQKQRILQRYCSLIEIPMEVDEETNEHAMHSSQLVASPIIRQTIRTCGQPE